MAQNSVNRKAIKDALFTRLCGAVFSSPINEFNTWATTGRRLKLWKNVDPSQQPALFLVQHREIYMVHGPGNLFSRYLDMGAWCYATTGDPTSEEPILGDDLLDIMESAIENVFGIDSPTRGDETLGGLCQWCRIDRSEGTFIRDPGDTDSQALLILPIRILLP